MDGRDGEGGLLDWLARDRAVLTVSDLNRLARDVVERRLVEVWVRGEVVGVSRPSSGHVYFELRDRTARVSCAMFRRAAGRLRFALEDGLEALVRGRPTLYERAGRFQLVVEQMEPYGAGARALAREQLRRRLDSEGLFAVEGKRPLPLLPRGIGVVTSPSGAALRDVLRVLDRRHGRHRVLLYPASVQGRFAVAELVAGLRALGERDDIDVVILARGGGAAEDLAAFDDERVVRAVAACPKPVITGVGHQTDLTLVDLAADLNAPTPSAAAELAVQARDRLVERVQGLSRRLERASGYALGRRRHRLAELLAHRAFRGVEARLGRLGQRLDELRPRLVELLRGELGRHRERVGRLIGRLSPRQQRERVAARRDRLGAHARAASRAVRDAIDRRRRSLSALTGRLDAVSPLAVLRRGYAICTDAQTGAIVRSHRQVRPGDALRVRVAEGGLECRVVERLRPRGTPRDGAGDTGDDEP